MNYVFKADGETIERITGSFDREYFRDPVPYRDYRIEYDSCVINIYTSGKVMFQGENARTYAASFFSLEEVEKQEEEKQVSPVSSFPQAGSDEVGTGDYFGPICVCACYMDSKIYRKVKQLNLIDSKQLTDKQILEIAPELLKHVPHSLLILDPWKYNEVHKQSNLNKIKALMHNKAYLNLKDKGIKLPKLTVIDQFCSISAYYNYIRDEQEIVRNITFQTKAENSYVSVACGAIISRYAFLKEMEKMSEKYRMQFPKGAGSKVDIFIKEFTDRYGIEELNRVAKTDYKNTAKALSQ